jgi:hypothetical protein
MTYDQRSKTAANKGFAIAGVPCFADTFVQGGSSVLRMKFSANNPRHRKPAKRCKQPYWATPFISEVNLTKQRL